MGGRKRAEPQRLVPGDGAAAAKRVKKEEVKAEVKVEPGVDDLRKRFESLSGAQRRVLLALASGDRAQRVGTVSSELGRADIDLKVVEPGSEFSLCRGSLRADAREAGAGGERGRERDILFDVIPICLSLVAQRHGSLASAGGVVWGLGFDETRPVNGRALPRQHFPCGLSRS